MCWLFSFIGAVKWPKLKKNFFHPYCHVNNPNNCELINQKPLNWIVLGKSKWNWFIQIVYFIKCTKSTVWSLIKMNINKMFISINAFQFSSLHLIFTHCFLAFFFFFNQIFRLFSIENRNEPKKMDSHSIAILSIRCIFFTWFHILSIQSVSLYMNISINTLHLHHKGTKFYDICGKKL